MKVRARKSSVEFVRSLGLWLRILVCFWWLEFDSREIVWRLVDRLSWYQQPRWLRTENGNPWGEP